MASAYKRHGMVLAAYIVLTLLMTLPVVFDLTGHVAGTGGDPWQTMWRFEDTLRSLKEGGMSFLVYELGGQGEPRLVNLSAWPWLWAQALFGQPTAYNVVWLLSFVLAGYGMYLLARYLFVSEAAAFLAGIAYMFLPYRIAHAQGHFGAMQTGWLPLIVWAALLCIRRPTLGRTVGLAALITIQAWSEHHYLLWLGLLGALAAWFFWSEVKTFWRERRGGLWLALLAVLLMLSVVLPYRPTFQLAMAPASELALGPEQTIRFSADPFAYITPSPWHPLWGWLAQFLFSQHFTGNRNEATHFLGLLPLLLTIFFWQALPRRPRMFWSLVAGVFLLISFGPRLHLLGAVTPLPLPLAALDELPIISSVRAVGRASAVVGLAWIVMLSGVLATQLRRRGAAALVLAVILLEFLFVPSPRQSAQISPVYAAVAASGGTAVVEVPAATNYTIASRALYASGQHGKQLVGNSALERAPAETDISEARSLPVLRQLLWLRTRHLLEDRTEFFEQTAGETLPDVLRWLDAEVVVVHYDSLSARQQQAARHVLEETLGATPEVWDDATLYRLPDGAGGDGVFLSRDERWQAVGFDSERAATYAQIKDSAGVTVYNVTDQVKTVTFDFSLAEESEGSLVMSAGGATVFDSAKTPGRQAAIRLEVAPGQTAVEFSNRLPGPVIIKNPVMRVL